VPHLVAFRECRDDTADENLVAIAELQAAEKRAVQRLGTQERAVDRNLFTVPFELERLRADDQRLVVLDTCAEDADIDDADSVLGDAS
jgi:hypothetical protein